VAAKKPSKAGRVSRFSYTFCGQANVPNVLTGGEINEKTPNFR
jgi:hypothetical protein